MTDKRDCCDDVPPGTQTVEQTLDYIKQHIHAVNTKQRLHIRQALGLVLAEDVVSHINVPPHRNSAMDGYAIRSDDLEKGDKIKLKIIAHSFAGKPSDVTVNNGECVRIMTGAMMPDGADTVVMQEHVELDNDNITIDKHHKPGQNVRHPGEDINQGDVILTAGKTITPADLGLLSSIGVNEITTYRKPVVAFFSTGDELKNLGETLGPGDIYDSNRYTLYGMLNNMDVELIDMGVVPDDRTALETTLTVAADSADLILSSGGASVGEADYVTEILEKMGQVNFWKVAMKPGKPLAFGFIKNTPFFGLPGNPVSVMATCYLFVQPAIQRLKGQHAEKHLALKAKLMSRLKKNPGRADFQRGILSQNSDGDLVVDTTGTQGSHILTSMSKANCFIAIPLESGDIDADQWINVLPFNDIL